MNSNHNVAKICVVGVGGAGCNAVAYMIDKIKNVDFYALNTDLQSLYSKKEEFKDRDTCSLIQIGQETTKGLGAGANPEIGRLSAEENYQLILETLKDYNMVFIAAGMGGGTGTGASPVVAKACRELDILTVAVVTTPFAYESRTEAANKGIEELQKYIDSLIVVPNNKLLKTLGEVNLKDALIKSDEVLRKSVQGISDIITTSGFINVDFADVKRVLSNSGRALIGIGRANGEDRARKATLDALDHTFLDFNNIKDAKGVLINVTGNFDLTLPEHQSVGDLVKTIASNNVVLISGMSYMDHADGDESDEIYVTVVVTNFDIEDRKIEDKKEKNIESSIDDLLLKTDKFSVHKSCEDKLFSKNIEQKMENNIEENSEDVIEFPCDDDLFSLNKRFNESNKFKESTKEKEDTETKKESNDEFTMPSFLQIS